MTDNRKRTKPALNAQYMDIGKMPPQAIELEEAVLGACMLEKTALEAVSDILRPESFYKEAHERIFSAIMTLKKENSPVDIRLVVQQLKKTDELDICGGAYYISQLTNAVASSANIEFHARIIAQKYLLREVIRKSTDSIRKAYLPDANCFDILNDMELNAISIGRDVQKGAKSKKMDVLWQEVQEKNKAILTKNGITGVPCGFDSIDAVTGGWQSPDLIIVAARPAMGKTGLACCFAQNAAVDHNRPTAFFSLEMSALQIGTRLFSQRSAVGTGQFSRKGIEKEEMFHVEQDCKKLIDAPLWIDDTAALTLSELKSKARKFVLKYNVELIIVDYLQLMSGEDESNRENEVSTISRGLKQLAKELNIPVIALSQLSRAVEKRGGDKRPGLSDLRESGAIEQDADIVMFIHRAEYYKISEYADGTPTAGTAEIIIEKYRNGPTGTYMLRFIDYLTKFESMAPSATGVELIDYTEPLKNNSKFLTAEDAPF